MDVIFISAATGVAWTFLRTSCGATVRQAMFAMTTGMVLVTMMVSSI